MLSGMLPQRHQPTGIALDSQDSSWGSNFLVRSAGWDQDVLKLPALEISILNWDPSHINILMLVSSHWFYNLCILMLQSIYWHNSMILPLILILWPRCHLGEKTCEGNLDFCWFPLKLSPPPPHHNHHQHPAPFLPSVQISNIIPVTMSSLLFCTNYNKK